MSRESLYRQRFATLLAILILLATPAHASFLGEENAALAALVAQGIEELNQVGQTLTTARQQLDLARDVYAGINYFTHFDPQAFLESEGAYFLSHIDAAGQVSSMVTDVTAHGVSGGSLEQLYSRFDSYRDAYRRTQAKRATGRAAVPYDPERALTVSAETEAALHDPTQRGRLGAKPDIASVSDGLFESDLTRVDPALLNLYLQRRAAAKEAEYQAYQLYAEAIGASPGKAQQLAAMATGMSAVELARINDKLSQSATTAQLDRHEKSISRAVERTSVDFLWDDIQQTAASAAPPTRGTLDWEPLP